MLKSSCVRGVAPGVLARAEAIMAAAGKKEGLQRVVVTFLSLKETGPSKGGCDASIISELDITLSRSCPVKGVMLSAGDGLAYLALTSSTDGGTTCYYSLPSSLWARGDGDRRHSHPEKRPKKSEGAHPARFSVKDPTPLYSVSHQAYGLAQHATQQQDVGGGVIVLGSHVICLPNRPIEKPARVCRVYAASLDFGWLQKDRPHCRVRPAQTNEVDPQNHSCADGEDELPEASSHLHLLVSLTSQSAGRRKETWRVLYDDGGGRFISQKTWLPSQYASVCEEVFVMHAARRVVLRTSTNQVVVLAADGELVFVLQPKAVKVVKLFVAPEHMIVFCCSRGSVGSAFDQVLVRAFPAGARLYTRQWEQEDWVLGTRREPHSFVHSEESFACVWPRRHPVQLHDSSTLHAPHLDGDEDGGDLDLFSDEVEEDGNDQHCGATEGDGKKASVPGRTKAAVVAAVVLSASLSPLLAFEDFEECPRPAHASIRVIALADEAVVMSEARDNNDYQSHAVASPDNPARTARLEENAESAARDFAMGMDALHASALRMRQHASSSKYQLVLRQRLLHKAVSHIVGKCSLHELKHESPNVSRGNDGPKHGNAQQQGDEEALAPLCHHFCTASNTRLFQSLPGPATSSRQEDNGCTPTRNTPTLSLSSSSASSAKIEPAQEDTLVVFREALRAARLESDGNAAAHMHKAVYRALPLLASKRE